MISEKHISHQRSAGTKAAIDRKLALLTDWVSNGIPWKLNADGSYVFDGKGDKVLVAYPIDVKSFSEWEGIGRWSEVKGEPDVELQAFARSTVNQKTTEYARLRIELKNLFESLKERAKEQIERANKSSIIERLQSDISFKDKVIAQQELDVVRLRREADAARKALGDEKDERAREAEEFRRRITELETDNAQHLATLAKVAPLRKKTL